MAEEQDFFTFELPTDSWVSSVVEWASVAKVYQEKMNLLAGTM
jgi:hypothetical protein